MAKLAEFINSSIAPALGFDKTSTPATTDCKKNKKNKNAITGNKLATNQTQKTTNLQYLVHHHQIPGKQSACTCLSCVAGCCNSWHSGQLAPGAITCSLICTVKEQAMQTK
mmetsp:Transcript_63128/g.104262  ORF Transcript_63128/g.104262 Transcript_63128/m.104262 type:complete len:111 (+) Transcript_63128:221-553(+)